MIGKSDLINLIRDQTYQDKKEIELTLISFLEIIEQQVLKNGSELRLKNFGTFKQKKTSARVGRNPKTGEEIQISSSTSLGFSASAGMKIKDTAE